MSSPSSSEPATESRSQPTRRPVQIKAGTSTYEALVGPGASH